MERYSASQRAPDVSPDERAVDEMLKRIRKLRWIGMEQEAQRLQTVLSECSPIFTAQLEPRFAPVGPHYDEQRTRRPFLMSNLG